MTLKHQTKALIEQLLNKNPAIRNAGSIEALKSHNWFKDFSWEDILTKQIPPPYKPRLPDITNDVEFALKIGIGFEQKITKEEMEDFDDSLATLKTNVTDWDLTF